MSRTYASVKFVKIGQGDCILITSPSGKLILVDAGSKGGVSNRAGSYNLDNVREALWGPSRQPGKAIEILVMTHHDADHFNKIGDVIGGKQIKKIYYSGYEQNYYTFAYSSWCWGANAYKRSARNVSKRNITPITVDSTHPGPQTILTDYTADGTEFTLDVLASNYIPPGTGWNQGTSNAVAINTRSIVIKGTLGDNSFLLTGDATSYTEEFLLSTNKALLRSNLVKVAHHGSGDSSTQSFVNATNPNVVVISVRPEGTRFKHPRQNIYDRWMAKVGSSAVSHEVAYWGPAGNMTYKTATTTKALWETGLNGSPSYEFCETDEWYQIPDPNVYPNSADDDEDDPDNPDEGDDD